MSEIEPTPSQHGFPIERDNRWQQHRQKRWRRKQKRHLSKVRRHPRNRPNEAA